MPRSAASKGFPGPGNVGALLVIPSMHGRRRFIAILLVCLSVLLWALTAHAQLVTPSDRVQTRLNVRAGPDTSTTVVGKLHPGEYAVHRGAVPYWHRIAMGDGTTGYVSKAWSEVVADVRIGTWNIERLGHGSSKDYELVSAIIDDTFDVLTVVEVMQKGGTHPGYDALLEALGSGWDGLVTEAPRPNTGAGHAEYYAVLFRASAARPCEGAPGLVYFQDNDGGPDGEGADRFAREPAYGCFAVLSKSGARTWDFILAAYHATWSDGDEDTISAEVSEIGRVFSAMATLRPAELDLLVAGDFNLLPNELEETVPGFDATVGRGSTLNVDGERTTNLYDHLLVRDIEATTELAVPAYVVDVRSWAANADRFERTVSDHLPIVGHFLRDQPDDD